MKPSTVSHDMRMLSVSPSTSIDDYLNHLGWSGDLPDDLEGWPIDRELPDL